MQTITCAEPRDVIALAWFQIGYRPRESLILIGLHGPTHRSGVMLRIDLPPAPARRAVARQLAHVLRRSGQTEVVLLVVSDAGGGPHAGPSGQPVLPHRGLVRELRRELPRGQVRISDALAVGPSSFRSYLCPDLDCCPAAGTALEDVMTSRVAAAMVLAGHSCAPDEHAIVADVEPGQVLPADALPGTGWGSPGDRAAGLARWSGLLGSDAGAVEDVPGLLAALEEPEFRDAVMLTLVPEVGDLPERLLQDAAVQDRLLGGGGPDPFAHRPDPELVVRGQRLLASVARCAPPGQRAEPLAVLAWLGWWTGDGARGRLLAERALKDRPEHRLAGLVGTLLAHCVPPPWATAPAS